MADNDVVCAFMHGPEADPRPCETWPLWWVSADDTSVGACTEHVGALMERGLRYEVNPIAPRALPHDCPGGECKTCGRWPTEHGIGCSCRPDRPKVAAPPTLRQEQGQEDVAAMMLRQDVWARAFTAAALICEGRANGHPDASEVRREAMKCAASIRSEYLQRRALEAQAQPPEQGQEALREAVESMAKALRLDAERFRRMAERCRDLLPKASRRADQFAIEADDAVRVDALIDALAATPPPSEQPAPQEAK